VYWLKDKEPVDADTDINLIISNEGNLLISQVRLTDTGNYTCVAENVASRRLTEPAQLTVYGTRNLLLHRLRLSVCLSFISPGLSFSLLLGCVLKMLRTDICGAKLQS